MGGSRGRLTLAAAALTTFPASPWQITRIYHHWRAIDIAQIDPLELNDTFAAIKSQVERQAMKTCRR